MRGGGLRGGVASDVPRTGEQIALQCRDAAGRRVWWPARITSARERIHDGAGVADGAARGADASGPRAGQWQCECEVEWLEGAKGGSRDLPSRLTLQPHAGPNWRREEDLAW